MPPIRKGDGTPVTPKGVSQIRTGDGRILFDGPAIPDLGMDHEYHATTIDDITDVWSDQVGDINLSPENSPSLSDINGKQAVLYNSDNNEAHESIDSAWQFSENSEYTYAVVIDEFQDSDGIIFTAGNAENDNGVRVEYRGSDYRPSFHSGVDSGPSGGDGDVQPVILVGSYDGSDIYFDLNGSTALDGVSVDSPNSIPSDDPVALAKRIGAEDQHFTGLVGSFGWDAGFSDSERRDNITDKLAGFYQIDVDT